MDVEMKKNTHLSNISCTHCGFSTKKGDVRQRLFERTYVHTHTRILYANAYAKHYQLKNITRDKLKTYIFYHFNFIESPIYNEICKTLFPFYVFKQIKSI